VHRFPHSREIRRRTRHPETEIIVYYHSEEPSKGGNKAYCSAPGQADRLAFAMPASWGKSPASSLLLQSGPPSFGGVAWEDPAFLRLWDENGEPWRYTFATQELQKGL